MLCMQRTACKRQLRCVLCCNTLNCTYQIIVISTSCWESGIKGHKTFASRAYTNFAVGRDICVQSIELNLLLHSKSWTIVLYHVKLHIKRFVFNPKRCIVLQHVKLYTWGKNLCLWSIQVLDAAHAFSNAKFSTPVPHQILVRFGRICLQRKISVPRM